MSKTVFEIALSMTPTVLVGECMASYDVTSLFTSVPIDPAPDIIKDLLENDEKLNDRTVVSV